MVEVAALEQQQNNARAMIYRWLSSLFSREIESQSLALLQGEEGELLFRQLSFQPELRDTSLALQDRLKGILTEEQRLHLAADYCGLFIVAGKFCVSPYAGAYLQRLDSGEDPPLFGPMHQHIVVNLKTMGFEVDKSFPEPADHIGVLLAYMAELCQQGSGAQQQQFMTDYLLSWQDDFSTQIERFDQGGFYVCLAKFYGLWLQLDKQWLRDG
ncbi:Chaperone protein TorD [Sinobacterium norvegicum]|uniref:Chaperone protein TorD n=1 Tax=Sinobacterium norvegicum TaxID=1641715 RepID=A0ABN8EFR2_9GAMM|nr:molecular chaperone TorD [Sinobacterium norvegicum]CAH0990488.1 Chaperone protein TorD [Sinobacterium norvegicum]